MSKREPFKKQDFTSTYESKNFSYPNDVTSSTEYGGNFAVFFINVQSQSKLRTTDQVVMGAITGLNNNSGVISAGTVAVVEGVVGAGGGAAIATAVGNTLFGTNDKAGSLTAGAEGNAKAKALATVVGGAVIKAGIVGAVAAESGGFSQPVKRLKTAIALHMPSQISTTYGVNYTESDMPFSYRALQAIGDAEGLGNTASTAGTIGAALALSMSNDAVSKLSKLASNPTTEMIFKSVDTRTFTFNYRFAPKSEAEAHNVLNIIQEFKFHMHPEFKDETSFLYIYPSEFDIVYYSGFVENDNIHRHTSCVLVNMSVNYSPNGVFSTFDNGMPTQIDVSLAFKELAKLDKKKITEGGY